MGGLHVTCGDEAAQLLIRRGVAEGVLPWRDVLHEGPVPGDLSRRELRAARAGFIAECGWGGQGEVLAFFEERDAAVARAAPDGAALWFEADLYDQLQLLEVLAVLAEAGARPQDLRVFAAPGFGELDRPGLERALRPLDAGGLEAVLAAWEAFRASDPTALSRLARGDFPGLPHLAPALRRLLEEYPAASGGLSRLERALLEAASRGPVSGGDLFRAASAREEQPYLGDWACWLTLERLLAGTEPLLAAEAGAVFPDRRVERTGAGARCLDGRADWMRLGGAGRWLGGVRLGHGPDWRYHPDTASVARLDGPGAAS